MFCFDYFKYSFFYVHNVITITTADNPVKEVFHIKTYFILSFSEYVHELPVIP